MLQGQKHLEIILLGIFFKEFHLKILLLLKQQTLFTMMLILEKVYIKLLNVFFFLKKCSSFFKRIFCNLHVFAQKSQQL